MENKAFTQFIKSAKDMGIISLSITVNQLFDPNNLQIAMDSGLISSVEMTNEWVEQYGVDKPKLVERNLTITL